jgi:hypothetical protein
MVCYRYQPLMRLLPRVTKEALKKKRENFQEKFGPGISDFKEAHVERIKGRYERLKEEGGGFLQRWGEKLEQKAEVVAGYKWVIRLSEFCHLNSKRMAISVVENLILNKIFFPIHFPLQIWLVLTVLRRQGQEPKSYMELYHDQESVTILADVEARVDGDVLFQSLPAPVLDASV